MKHKEAQECVLSIILDEPNLRLIQVRVEDVFSNKNGKRGIRLDAWALAEDSRQFATEMQNDASEDDLQKRSRYYQGLLDTPALKAGKHTKYRTCLNDRNIHHPDRSLWNGSRHVHIHRALSPDSGDGAWG